MWQPPLQSRLPSMTWRAHYHASRVQDLRQYAPPTEETVPQLEAFLGHWRQFLQPQHNLMFSQLNGVPMTMQAVYKVFHTSAFRISGKKTNPHLVRDMVVTHLRSVPPVLPFCMLLEQRSSCLHRPSSDVSI